LPKLEFIAHTERLPTDCMSGINTPKLTSDATRKFLTFSRKRSCLHHWLEETGISVEDDYEHRQCALCSAIYKRIRF